jgi:hypothetical protein
MISLRTREPEETLLQDRILAIPERKTKAETAESVTQSEQTILTPPVDTTPGLIKGKGVPDIAISRVVLADCTPLSLGEIGAPELPEAFAS